MYTRARARDVHYTHQSTWVSIHIGSSACMQIAAGEYTHRDTTCILGRERTCVLIAVRRRVYTSLRERVYTSRHYVYTRPRARGRTLYTSQRLGEYTHQFVSVYANCGRRVYTLRHYVYTRPGTHVHIAVRRRVHIGS